MNIYVGNLSRDVTEDQLKQSFEAFGEVKSAAVIKDKLTGEPRGFGFVEMPSKDQAMAAIEGLNGKDIGGREVKVNEAHERKDNRGGGGRGPRRGGFGGGGGGFGGGGRGRGEGRYSR